jgi:GNAT superfamily N-acetyltransferase
VGLLLLPRYLNGFAALKPMFQLQLLNSTPADTDEIFRLYQLATDYQKTKPNSVIWLGFERSLVEQEIRENRQWKLLINGVIACVWATTDDDPEIWEERNADPAVYIHRIATNPDFRGQDLVAKIVAWAIGYAQQNGKKFVRLDTVGDNQGLIRHYTSCGFTYLGLVKLKNTAALPTHYQNSTVSLFELPVGK